MYREGGGEDEPTDSKMRIRTSYGGEGVWIHAHIYTDTQRQKETCSYAGYSSVCLYVLTSTCVQIER